MKESELQNKILRFLEHLSECWCVKVMAGNRRGIPDIICCIKGRFVAFECKSENGKVTPLQQHEIDKIKESYGTAWVVRSMEDVKIVLNKVAGFCEMVVK